MVERGKQVDLDARDEDAWTPLHWAAQEGHLFYICINK